MRHQGAVYEQARVIADSPAYAPCAAAVASAYSASYYRAVENLRALLPASTADTDGPPATR